MKRRVVALLMTAVMVASLAACGNPDDSPKSTGSQNEADDSQASDDSQAAEGDTADDGEKKVLRYGIESAPSGIFLEQYHNDQYNGYVTYTVFEGLTQANMEGKQEMLLAKDYEVSEDGKTYTFYLNEGIKWHDGEDFTADDVAFTYQFMADGDYTGFYTDYISKIDGYEAYHSGETDTLAGVEVIDEYTIAITTTEVYSSLLAKIGNIKIIPEHIWKDVDIATADQQTDLIRNPIGTGAFKLGEFVPDQYVTLVANEDYWRGTPKLDEIDFILINAETVQAQLMNGEIDYYELLNINQDDMDMYESEGLQTAIQTGNSYQCMGINCEDPVLSKVEVRQALAYAIDRQGMVDALLYGYGNVANTIYCESYWAHPGNENLTCFEYNPEKAIELLESIGWSYDEDANVMSDENGNPVSFSLMVPTGNTVREQSGTVIQANLNAIGIAVDVQTMEFATVIDAIGDLENPEAYQLALFGYGLGADPDVTLLVGTGGSVNFSRYSNEDVDAQIARALQSTDEAEQEAAWNEMASIVSETLPCLYLYNMSQGSVFSDKVVTVYDNTYWNAYNTYLWEVK